MCGSWARLFASDSAAPNDWTGSYSFTSSGSVAGGAEICWFVKRPECSLGRGYGLLIFEADARIIEGGYHPTPRPLFGVVGTDQPGKQRRWSIMELYLSSRYKGRSARLIDPKINLLLP